MIETSPACNRNQPFIFIKVKRGKYYLSSHQHLLKSNYKFRETLRYRLHNYIFESLLFSQLICEFKIGHIPPAGSSIEKTSRMSASFQNINSSNMNIFESSQSLPVKTVSPIKPALSLFTTSFR